MGCSDDQPNKKNLKIVRCREHEIGGAQQYPITALNQVLTAPGWDDIYRLDRCAYVEDICFVSPSCGWLVDSSGLICRTDDGGINWLPQLLISPRLNSRPYPCCIDFSDSSVGWCGAITSGKRGYQQTLLHYTCNGGLSWRAVANLPQQVPPGLSAVAAVGSDVVYAVGSHDPLRNQLSSLAAPAVVKSTDGGRSWQLLDMIGLADSLTGVHFFDALHGFIVGGKRAGCCPGVNAGDSLLARFSQLQPVVLETTDGGRTWVDVIGHLRERLSCASWADKLLKLDGKNLLVPLRGATSALLRCGRTGSWALGRVNAYGVTEFTGPYTEDTDPRPAAGAGPTTSVSLTPDFLLSLLHQGPNRQTKQLRVFDHVRQFVAYSAGDSLYKFSQLQIPKPKSNSFSTRPVRSFEWRKHCGEHAGLALRWVEPSAESKPEFSYRVPSGANHVFVGVWDQMGWPVKTLIEERHPQEGCFSVSWDGTDHYGKPMHGSRYICRAVSGQLAQSCSFFLAP